MRNIGNPSLKWFIVALFCCSWTDLYAAERVATLDLGWTARVCQPPKTLCRQTVEQLAQGTFLDFRAHRTDDSAAPRFLSPFSIERIDPLDKTRCPAKLCAADLALAGLQENLLKQGYYTHSVAVFPGGTVITLRTERIDGAMKVLKGKCRFDLDPTCSDSDAWLQDDHKSGEKCGFSLTRVFVAIATLPAFVDPASFVPAFPTQVAAGKPAALRSVSFDIANVKVYELLYVHKVCPSVMTIVCNG
jgi:hypothetical protein